MLDSNDNMPADGINRLVLDHGDARVYHGDCRDVLAAMPNASVDAVVTDPPYELGFMGKSWDATGVAYDVALWEECLRVLKPGGHLLAFSGTRTYHRMAVAIEDAGFEMRDQLAWLYGTGFPKSLDVSKAIDKRPGVARHAEFAAHLAERREASGLSRADVSERVVGTRTGACWNWEHHQFPEARWWPALRDLLDLSDEWGEVIAEAEREKVGERDGTTLAVAPGQGVERPATTIDITAARTPEAVAWEGWGTALKPALEPIAFARKPIEGTVAANVLRHGTGALNIAATRIPYADEADLRTAQAKNPGRGDELVTSGTYGADRPQQRVNEDGRWPTNLLLDEDGAAAIGDEARFFYVAKPTGDERGRTNTHPTVKPIELMRYLVRLVTPPGGVVLDPFAGSGTTLLAARREGFDSIGVELTDDYLPIIASRLEREPVTLFGGAA